VRLGEYDQSLILVGGIWPQQMEILFNQPLPGRHLSRCICNKKVTNSLSYLYSLVSCVASLCAKRERQQDVCNYSWTANIPLAQLGLSLLVANIRIERYATAGDSIVIETS
jgi:hypothetical protein